MKEKAKPQAPVSGVDRRTFLKGTAAAAGAAMAAGAQIAAAAEAAPKAAAEKSQGNAKLPSETFITHPGSDFMAEVLKSIGLQYIAINPAAGFRSLHESIINHLGNRNPEIIHCLHEESATGMAHGYAKASGKPMAVMVHGTVGLQHASMALYNAWCDRVPLMIFGGNGIDAETRRPGVEWIHSAQDPAALVREFVKWDDQPASLQHFAESTLRAYKYTMTAPMEPVMIAIDMDLQEEGVEHADRLRIPKVTRLTQPQGDTSALREAAQMLVAAEKPVILADRAARSQEGVKRLVALAEALGAPVVDLGGRMNFPSTHDLDLTFMKMTLLRDTDAILLLEVGDPWGNLNSFSDPYKTYGPLIKPGTRVISIGMQDVYRKSNYQDIQRFMPTDLAINGDVEATLPDFIEAVKRATTPERKTVIAERAKAHAKLHRQMRERDKNAAALGWDAVPVSTSRLAAEMWNAIRNEKWALVVSDRMPWARRLWPVTEHYQLLGGNGGYGLGGYAQVGMGAALANRDKGILSVMFQPDGDMLYAPGVLWTAAHHKIPLLMLMHNNRCYHQEIMHVQRMAAIHDRPQATARIGTEITDPNVDFAKLAQGFGVWAEGPVTDPGRVGPALQRALAEVKNGRPALVDVVCQPR
ncbi:MAG TPA: thiamine pyrophosphate-binding protein [Burkholderiales bacterium]|nr:thiamine pyrophosphate-binding protein [Burkholderiales bacterium]